MIARFQVLLPFELSIPLGAELPPIELEAAPYRIKIHPPCQGALNPALAVLNLASLETRTTVPVNQLTAAIRPADPPIVIATHRIDGQSAIQANLLRIDFLKDSFDRSRTLFEQQKVSPTAGDPPVQVAFDVANQFLAQLRLMLWGASIRPVSRDDCFWRLDYLADDEREFPPSSELIRTIRYAPSKVQFTLLTPAAWKQIRAQSLRPTQPVWYALLLDASALLPEIGPAVVVANAALEVFITWCLDELASTAPIPRELWHWINQRESFWQEPSVADRFDILLHALTGRSLKKETELWQAFQELRRARNSFAHAGRPTTARPKQAKSEEQLTVQAALALVQRARSIIDWVEASLPEAQRRPKLQEEGEIHISWIIPVIGSATELSTPEDS